MVAKEDILQASERIKAYTHRTPVFTSKQIDELLGGSFYFKCENYQKAGAFKSRGAVNVVMSLDEASVRKGVATHSSGNHAQALARAAALRSVPAYIVMPRNAPDVKIAAVRQYGGQIRFCEPTLSAREESLKAVIAETGAHEVHPYDDFRIIAGQATAAMELLQQVEHLDCILCPVGGGGLLSGTALSAAYFSKGTKVIGCEPLGADDAYRSFKSGKLIPSLKPLTIADGLLTSLGERNFPIIMKWVNDISSVSEQAIIDAMRLLFERMKIVVEPSAAVPLAVILEHGIPKSAHRIGLILSGGNVDLAKLPF